MSPFERVRVRMGGACSEVLRALRGFPGRSARPVGTQPRTGRVDSGHSDGTGASVVNFNCKLFNNLDLGHTNIMPIDPGIMVG